MTLAARVDPVGRTRTTGVAERQEAEIVTSCGSATPRPSERPGLVHDLTIGEQELCQFQK